MVLTEELDRLYAAAKEAAANSYSPYSEFRVGAALLGANGRIFTGTNVENASFGLTMCAERVAAFKGVSEGETGFSAIAIACEDGKSCAPCGACRQVLYEFAPSMKLVYRTKSGELTVRRLSDMLPDGFGGGDL